MSRIRSPNYPALSLPDALTRVAKIHAAEQHLAAPRDVIVKHLGYGGINGASAKVISAIQKYGLLEDVAGDKVRVSPLAVSILHPSSPEEHRNAISVAAYHPTLFAEIATEYEGKSPSDHNLRSYLIRRNFAQDAVDRVIQSYRETMELVAREGGAYDSFPEAENPAPAQEPAVHVAAALPVSQPPPSATLAPGGDPFRLAFSPSGGLEGGFRINTAEDLNGLVRALQGMAFIFKMADSIKPPQGKEDDDPETVLG